MILRCCPVGSMLWITPDGRIFTETKRRRLSKKVSLRDDYNGALAAPHTPL